MKKEKFQSVVEFLLTYGWAVLAAIFVIIVLIVIQDYSSQFIKILLYFVILIVLYKKLKEK